MTPAIQKEQSILGIHKIDQSQAVAISDNLTRIFKNMQSFPKNLSKPAIIFGVDLGMKKWVANAMHPVSKGGFKIIAEAGKHIQLLAFILEAMLWHGVKDTGEVVVCYEIGADGTWLKEYLNFNGIPCVIFTPDVLATRGKNPKTDRLDARRLCEHLCCFYERRLVAEHIFLPSSREHQVSRDISRFRNELVEERTRLGNKFKSKLKLHMELPAGLSVGTVVVESLRDALDRPLPDETVHELKTLQHLYNEVDKAVAEQEKTMAAHVKNIATDARAGRTLSAEAMNMMKLLRVKGIGIQTAWILVHELFHKDFTNVGQVSAATGLVDTPRASGKTERSAGISRRSNNRLRGALVELGWMWLRYQAGSEIAKWFESRTALGVAHKRMKKVAIVAVGRRIAVALWKYLKFNEPIEGATIKEAV